MEFFRLVGYSLRLVSAGDAFRECKRLAGVRAMAPSTQAFPFEFWFGHQQGIGSWDITTLVFIFPFQNCG